VNKFKPGNDQISFWSAQDDRKDVRWLLELSLDFFKTMGNMLRTVLNTPVKGGHANPIALAFFVPFEKPGEADVQGESLKKPAGPLTRVQRPAFYFSKTPYPGLNARQRRLAMSHPDSFTHRPDTKSALLQKWRRLGRGRFSRASGRIRYRLSDIEAFAMAGIRRGPQKDSRKHAAKATY
jgi:hypothetical protein